MRIAWLTDIHLDHAEPLHRERMLEDVRAGDAERVIITGDIGEAGTLVAWLELLSTRLGLPIDLVLGNHDYYGGSVEEVRAAARALEVPGVRWLPAGGPVLLGSEVALVGHGGWGDARAGSFDRSGVMLNDFIHIKELSFIPKRVLKARLQALGDDAAATLEPQLRAALAQARTVIVATHVPPFLGACWYMGQVSNADWSPHFTCVAMGEMLARVAAEHAEQRLIVLCGHTHSRGVFQAAPNLVVYTGEADYGEPVIEGWIELEPGGRVSVTPLEHGFGRG